MPRPELVNISCPSCQNGLRVRREHDGRKTTCPKCQTKFRIALDESKVASIPVAKPVAPKPKQTPRKKVQSQPQAPVIKQVAPTIRPQVNPRSNSGEYLPNEKKGGISWVVALLLLLVGFFAACSVMLAVFLLRQPANDTIVANHELVNKESHPAVESPAVDTEAASVQPVEKDWPIERDLDAEKPDVSPVDAVTSDLGNPPNVFSSLSVGNELGYSVSISASVFEERHRVAVGGNGMGGGSRGGGAGGRGDGLGNRFGRRGGGFGGFGRESEIEEPQLPQPAEEETEPPKAEIVRWEGLASFAVTKKSAVRGSKPSKGSQVFGLGIPGQHVLTKRVKMKETTAKVRINGRLYEATAAASGSSRSFMVLKIVGSPVDFKPLPASRATEIQPYKRFDKSVWNSVWKETNDGFKSKRSVVIGRRSKSHAVGAICWRDTGKIGGICFDDYFVPAKSIQDLLPDEYGDVFNFDLKRESKSNFAKAEMFEKQISENLVEVIFESKKVESDVKEVRSPEEIQITQEAWLGQFLDDAYLPNEGLNLRGPFVYKSNRFWYPSSLSVIERKLVDADDSKAPSSMPLLLPRMDQIVFQDYAEVSTDSTRDALVVPSKRIALLDEGEAANIPLDTQYRVGKYHAKVTSIEKGDLSTKVFRKISMATSGAEPPSKKAARSGRSSSGSTYAYPVRIEQDEVVEFDNQTGVVQSVEISGSIFQGPGASRQTTVPYTVNIEKTKDPSPISTPTIGPKKLASGDLKKLEMSSKLRNRVADLLGSRNVDERAKGLEMLNLYEPRREERISMALSKTLDKSYWNSDLIYPMACDWIYDARIHDLLKDVDRRNDFRENPLEQQTILYLVEKFPSRVGIGNTYDSLFKGLMRVGDKTIQLETIRVLSESFPRLFEKIVLQSEMFMNANRKPSLAVIDLLGELGTSRTVDELADRVEELESKKKSRRVLQRNEASRLRAYQAAIEQIQNRVNGRRR